MGLELLLIFPPGLGDAAAAVYTTVADVGHRTRNGEPKKSGIFYPTFLKTALQAVNIVFQIKKIALITIVYRLHKSNYTSTSLQNAKKEDEYKICN